MTKRHLKIFSEVYTTGSMTAAAKKLYMTQPSVSQAIRELEAHYHTMLFERLYRRLYPTAAGDHLFQYAGKLLGMFDEIEAVMQAEDLNQTLNLGLFFTAGMLAFPWLNAFRLQHPSMQVHVQVFKGSELKQLLRTAQLDLAVMEESVYEEDLIQEVFAEDQLVAVTSPENPLLIQETICVEDLVCQPLLLREKGAGVRDQFDAQMQALGYCVKPRWESASSLVLLDAARHREGIAILPFELARAALERGEVSALRVSGIDFHRRMALTWHKDKYITSAMQDFISLVKSIGIPSNDLA